MKTHEAMNHLSQLVQERVHFWKLHLHVNPPTEPFLKQSVQWAALDVLFLAPPLNEAEI